MMGPKEDAQLERLRDDIDQLRIQLSLASDREAGPDLIADLQQQIIASETSIAYRMRSRGNAR